jgi:NhaP-type Na+/H+ or K+/H+ antiporter
MITVLVYAFTLLLAVLISEVAQRSILSTAVLFLAIGFICGASVLDVLAFAPDHPVVSQLAEFALFSVLFTDGMHIGIRELISAWHLPGRALLLGMPLTCCGTALLARLVAQVPWAEAFLVGAVLSPTDPVFAAAVVGREEIPQRVRRLLNVESGLNDGLALPAVVALLLVVGKPESPLETVLGEVVLGAGLGVVVPWVAIRLEQSRVFAVASLYQPLHTFAIGLLVLALASLTHANLFLAAFAAGVTIATVSPQLEETFNKFGALVTELLKLAALLIFGTLVSLEFLHGNLALWDYLFAVLVLLVARLVSLSLALLGSSLPWRERLTAAWFGPKGFASVVFGLMIWQSEATRAEHLFHLVALVIVASIVVHSSTDVLISRWFNKAGPQQGQDSAAAQTPAPRTYDAGAS